MMVTARKNTDFTQKMSNNNSINSSIRTRNNRSNERSKRNGFSSEINSVTSSRSTEFSENRKISSSSDSFVSNSSWKSKDSENGSVERLNENNMSRRIPTTFPEIEDNIHVVVRVRPLNSKEIRSADNSTVDFPGSGQIVVYDLPSYKMNQNGKTFSFDAVFEPPATQEDVFEFCGIKKLIEMSVEGFRSTVFCYGQTGSGKTHTLIGPPGLFLQKPSLKNVDHGLVVRSFSYLFSLLRQNTKVNYCLKASFLEIYNEKIIDLLNPGTNRKSLPIRWSKKTRGFFVDNLFTVICEEFDDLLAVLEEGNRNRSIGRHNMNDYSSRSHTILTINIMSEQPSDGGVFISRTGKLNFVDLAGSEITKKTQSGGKTLEEANNINKSLMVLGYCISSLSDPKKKGNHIPYRDSNLTKLLADSLAGNGVTLMIACISPAKSNQSESLNTLRYASRAKKIKTKPAVLMDPREALILNLKKEIIALQSENDHLKTAINLHQNSPLTKSLSEIDLKKISELEVPELVDLVRHYANENENLKKENLEIYLSRDELLRDHEMVCRENERLLKKLEDVNIVCCRSPLIPARPAYSAGDLDTVLPENLSSKTAENIPRNITKELDIRQIGKVNMSARNRRSSWNGKIHPVKTKTPKPGDTTHEFLNRSGRRFSIATDDKKSTVMGSKQTNNLEKNLDIFGSAVSLIENQK